MTKSVLLVGGSGPTGPHVIQGLHDRGYDITVFHRGKHDPPDTVEIEHVHGDPHFRETIDESLGTREFDLVIAAYGRVKYLAAAFANRTEKFISMSGTPRYVGYSDPWRTIPFGTPIPIREDAPLVTEMDAEGSRALIFGQKIVEGENAVFESHKNGTVLVYPVVYGPRNITPWEWSVIKRVQDGRTQIVLPEGGMAIHRRGASRNMAEMVMRVIDHPDVSAGQVYNCADSQQYSLRQWVETIADLMGSKLEVIGVPAALAPIFKAIYIPNYQAIADHTMFDTSKAQRELGYVDVVSPREALAESIAWYLENPVGDPSSYPGYHDTFDYAMEDRVVRAWIELLTTFPEQTPTPVPEDFHPMPHPTLPGALADARNR